MKINNNLSTVAQPLRNLLTKPLALLVLMVVCQSDLVTKIPLTIVIGRG